MNEMTLITLLSALLALRLASVARFWRLPIKQGTKWFLSAPVGADFYQTEGRIWLSRYRLWLVAPLLLDAMIVAGLVVRGNWFHIFYEQFVAFVLTAVWFNFTVLQFAARVRALQAVPATSPVSAVQLSLTPRRLRDHLSWPVEAVLAGLGVVVLLLLANLYAGWWRGGVAQDAGTIPVRLVVWFGYLQLGLLLLKQLFVRWRMKLPVRRVAEYQRWRAAWLTYHLRVFDALRLAWASLLCVLLVHWTAETWLTDGLERFLYATCLLLLLCFAGYCLRERRRLSVVEREVGPLELSREFPPTPLAEGRFLAGGFLYVNSDTPVMLARSPSGLALNLAHRGIYVWGGYLVGLILLVWWQAAR